MNDTSEILRCANFGSRIAEDEIEELISYFVETEQGRKIISGEIDIIFGAKGAGKSALYSLLVQKKEELRLGKRTVFCAAENPRGTPVFRDLVTEPPMDEEKFRGLWKLFFLSIAANYMRHQLEVWGVKNDKASIVIDYLANNDMLAPNINLMSRLKSVLNFLKKSNPTFEVKLIEPVTGLEYCTAISLGEPSVDDKKNGCKSVDELLEILNSAFIEKNITVWLVLDRLDVAFTDSKELEGNAIRALFRAYLDMMPLSQIRLKIFLRDDIWKEVVKSGFREASHITRSITLSWDKKSLLNLIVRRLVSNEGICEFYSVSKEEILGNISLQEDFFYRIFPQKVEKGSSKPSTFDWMLTRTADGTKRNVPRELIHLLLTIRDEQLSLDQIGNPKPSEGRLFDTLAIRSALPAVSRIRYDQTLCAEHPKLKQYLDRLEREKTQQTKKSLAKLWGVPQDQAFDIAEKCVEVGFFERRGPKEDPYYWVPFLYRDALDLIQGSVRK